MGLCSLCFMVGCKENVVYQNSDFKITKNQVNQGDYEAKAISPKQLVSDYQSKANSNVSSELQFKFSINGKDNELDYNVNHHANIYATKGQEMVVDVVFGKKSELPHSETKEQALETNTRVKLRLDMNPVLKEFNTRGYFQDVHGEKIYKGDFKGVYVAGSTFPLNWDFENLTSNKNCCLTDPDGDGIYETQLVFNVYNPDAHTSSQWNLENDISSYPQFTSDNTLLSAIYNLSLDELVKNIEADSTFRTGEKWAGVWTRDVSYSILLSLAMVEPEIAKISLLCKVQNNRIIQDTGTGGAWPVSSDRVVWALAAWEVYKATGDKQWLSDAFHIISNSVSDDQKTIVDTKTGLIKGESSFLDWRKQTYPLWMDASDIASSMNLGTNAAYYKVLMVLGDMSRELQIPDQWSQQAKSLKQNINKWLWSAGKNYYGQYLYGRDYKSLSPRSEALGEAFCVLFDIADNTKKNALFNHVPLLSYGIPCIYPQIPNISPYHNNGIWPFVQAFWTLAAKKENHSQMVSYGMGSMVRQAALFLTNKENMVAQDGDFAGTVLNSDRQLWSVAGQLSMVYRILFGLDLQADSISFSPLVPKALQGVYHLKGFTYRESSFDITVKGYGDGISSFKVDGKERSTHALPSDIMGHHTIEIVLNSHNTRQAVSLVDNAIAPETPMVEIKNNLLKWNSIDEAFEYHVYVNGKFLKSQNQNHLSISSNDPCGEYQVLCVDSYKRESFLSNPVEFVRVNNSSVWQMEINKGVTQSNENGYHGRGYILLTKKSNTHFALPITVANGGSYKVKFRYANGSGPINTDNKCAIRSLYLNKEFVTSVVFPQRGKDEWSNWGYTSSVYVNLKKGKNILALGMEAWNENMNIHVNRCFVDEVIITKMQ